MTLYFNNINTRYIKKYVCPMPKRSADGHAHLHFGAVLESKFQENPIVLAMTDIN